MAVGDKIKNITDRYETSRAERYKDIGRWLLRWAGGALKCVADTGKTLCNILSAWGSAISLDGTAAKTDLGNALTDGKNALANLWGTINLPIQLLAIPKEIAHGLVDGVTAATEYAAEKALKYSDITKATWPLNKNWRAIIWGVGGLTWWASYLWKNIVWWGLCYGVGQTITQWADSLHRNVFYTWARPYEAVA